MRRRVQHGPAFVVSDWETLRLSWSGRLYGAGCLLLYRLVLLICETAMRHCVFVLSTLAVGLAGCGGSGNPAEVEATVPVPEQPTPTPTPDVPLPPTPPVVSASPITLAQVNANAAGFAALLTDLNGRDDPTELAPLDTVADLQARGSASYDGALYIYGNASRVDGFVGNSVIDVGFADPNSPTVTGSADGFIYVDGPELAAVIESETFDALPDDTPTFVADGGIRFTNGELANTSGVATAGFEIAGRLTADVDGTTQTADVDGALVVLFDGNTAFGVGGNTDDPDFDLNAPEAFFFGTADR